MKRIIVKALAGFAVVAAVMIATTTSKHIVPAIFASSGCSLSTLNGHYAVIQPAGLSGRNSTGNAVPWQYVGIETFDGAGNTSVSYTVAINGDIYTNQSATGVYNVNPDCSGSLLFNTGDAAGFSANIVVASGGTEIFGVVTLSGDTASFVEKKQ